MRKKREASHMGRLQSSPLPVNLLPTKDGLYLLVKCELQRRFACSAADSMRINLISASISRTIETEDTLRVAILHQFYFSLQNIANSCIMKQLDTRE